MKTEAFKVLVNLKNAKTGSYNIEYSKCIKIETVLMIEDNEPKIEVIVKLVSVRGKLVAREYAYFTSLETANNFISYFNDRLY